MVDVSTRKKLREFLEKQPRDVVVVFAARAALRALPALNDIFEAPKKPEKFSSAIISPILYGMVTALSAGTWSDRAVDALAAHAADAAARAARAALAAHAAAHAAHAAAHAAALAAHAAHAAHAADAAAHAAALAAHAAHAADAADAADAEFIEAGHGAQALSFRPLWPDGKTPDHLQDLWLRLKSELYGLDEDWQVWTSWYEDILKGGARNPDLEIARISFPPEDYNNAALVNKKILDLYPKPVPAQNPATVRPIERDGKYYSDHSPLTPDLSDQLALDNLLSLKDEMLDLAQSVRGEGNIDNRAAKYMEKTAEMVPGILPNSRTLMRLVRREAVLLLLEPTVRAQWPDMLAAQYSATCTELTNVLDQFSDRREYRRQQMESELEDFADDELADEMAQLNNLFRSETGRERIDESIPTDIEGIADEDPDILDLSPEMVENRQEMIRSDQFESANNVMKALASGLMNDETRKSILHMAEHRYKEGFAKGLDKGAFEAGQIDGERAAKTAMRARAAQEIAKAGGKKLSEKYPKHFAWLKRLGL